MLFRSEILIEELVRARFTFLDLAYYLIIGVLGTQVLNWRLHIIFLTENLSLLSLLLEGALLINDVSLSNHKLSLSFIGDKALPCTIQRHFT